MFTLSIYWSSCVHSIYVPLPLPPALSPLSLSLSLSPTLCCLSFELLSTLPNFQFSLALALSLPLRSPHLHLLPGLLPLLELDRDEPFVIGTRSTTHLITSSITVGAGGSSVIGCLNFQVSSRMRSVLSSELHPL